MGTYSEEIIPEFHAFYIATVRGSIKRWEIPTKQDPLINTIVQGYRVDISECSICRFLYGPTTGAQRTSNTAEFDYRWQVV